MNENNPVCAASFPSELEAEMARMRLEQNGIRAFITKDDCGGMLPYMQAFTGVRLMVRQADAAAAAEALNVPPWAGDR